MSNNAFSFGGVDLGAYGLSIQKGIISGLGFSEPKYQVTEYSQAYGGAIKGSKLRARQFTVPVAVVGSSFDDLWSKIESIKQLLAPSQGEQALIFDYKTNRQITCRLARGIEFPLRATVSVTMDLQFIASDPLIYAISDTTVTDTDGTETIAYAGSANAPCVVIGDPDGGTIGGTLSVENTTTGQKVSCDYSLGIQWIKFDGEREVIEVSADDGATWTNINSYLSATDYFFPELQAGNNDFVFTGFTNNSLSAYTWKTTYTARFF